MSLVFCLITRCLIWLPPSLCRCRHFSCLYILEKSLFKWLHEPPHMLQSNRVVSSKARVNVWVFPDPRWDRMWRPYLGYLFPSLFERYNTRFWLNTMPNVSVAVPSRSEWASPDLEVRLVVITAHLATKQVPTRTSWKLKPPKSGGDTRQLLQVSSYGTWCQHLCGVVFEDVLR